MPDVTAIDMSKWGGDFTRAEAECCVANGCTTAILGTGLGGYAENILIQADDVVAVGMVLEAYYFWEWGNDPTFWIQAGKDAMGEFAQHVKRIWIDVEDTGHPVPANWRDELERVFKAADSIWAGVPVEIYWPIWYMRQMGIGQNDDVTVWNGRRRKQWNSWYDNDPDIDGYPFAGFTRDDVAIEQFAGTSDFCGQSVDLNHVYIPATGEEDWMSLLTPDQQKALLFRLFAGSEEDAKLSDDERLKLAIYRIGDGKSAQSLADTALSALAIANDSHPSTNSAAAAAAVQERVQKALEKAAETLK